MGETVEASVVCNKLGHRFTKVHEMLSKSLVNYCGRCGKIEPLPNKDKDK